VKGSTATQAERPSETYVDGLGRKAGTVYFDRLGHRRVVTPPEHDDNGTLLATGAKVTATLDAHLDEAQELNRQALAKLKPHQLARFETWLRSRTHAAPPMRPLPSVATSGLPSADSTAQPNPTTADVESAVTQTSRVHPPTQPPSWSRYQSRALAAGAQDELDARRGRRRGRRHPAKCAGAVGFGSARG
jgi:hypothetical protein